MTDRRQTEQELVIHLISIVEGDATDYDVWLYEYYQKEHLKSLGVVE